MERVHISKIVTKPEIGSVVFNDIFLKELKKDSILVENKTGNLTCDIDLDAIACISF